MDVRQMRYFVAIVEQGSFSRAAAHLHVAQPALSLHVRNMEQDLGTALLFRSPKGVVPTEAGAILLRHARVILDQFTIAEEEIRGHESEPAGEVRLGLPGTISEILSVPLITAVHQRYPKIRLRIAEAMSGFVLEWMRAARIDLAVVYREISDEGLATTHLLDEELVFFGPTGAGAMADLPDPGECLPLERIASIPLVVPGEAHGLRELLDQQARNSGIPLTIGMEVDAYSNIKELVAGGFGHSILPLNAIRRETAAGRLRYWHLSAPMIRRPVHLASSVERPMTNATKAVLMLVQEVLRDLVHNDGWLGATLHLPDQPPPKERR
ncbi:LysR family transcriptional regulator, nitrogen assimilation regulatory protein [Gemmobacter megaterium]|uniref:LysR family transcriptional regulator, nitrogen assimilation regulatory protein n=1 Tax=Gemmobacter megaterium TaxID=1086013 RepID=A0A1N7PBE3_9RHOB|nr:LysR substrate-binding domain-containing protein [Gemmobacter megaterium]GGE19271.1 LysR family transcriptional regulator [Gemmobacter megaterium]SIT07868.1 LysR family transcriptional regulator, nitrogen assimilation regulatory protein [Gemmobacter megaterium]